jgi:predicted TIM-barrel fold metal-dependent hydrolase
VIIDSHAHIGYAFALRVAGLYATPLAEDYIDVMDEHGLNIACISPTHYQGTPGHPYDPDFNEANRQVAQEARKYPKRLIPFLRVNPNFTDRVVDQMKRAYEYDGVKGMGELHPMTDHYQVNDLKLLEPVMRYAAEYKWPIHWHTGNWPTCQAALYEPLAAAFPEVNHILGHMQYLYLQDAIVLAQRYPNIYLETAGNGTTEAMRQVIDTLGAERLIYGDDIPFNYPSDVLDKIRLMPDVTDTERKLMLGGNMARLLAMDI